MADNSKKVSELPLATNVASTDRILILRSPSSDPSVRTITTNNFANALLTLLPVILPNSVVTSNSVTITSNGTANVSFFTFDSSTNGINDAVNIKIHARDANTGDISTGEIFCVANTTAVNSNVLFAEIGANKIKFNPTPTINNSTGIVTLFVNRESAATSNVLIKYLVSYH